MKYDYMHKFLRGGFAYTALQSEVTKYVKNMNDANWELVCITEVSIPVSGVTLTFKRECNEVTLNNVVSEFLEKIVSIGVTPELRKAYNFYKQNIMASENSVIIENVADKLEEILRRHGNWVPMVKKWREFDSISKDEFLAMAEELYKAGKIDND